MRETLQSRRSAVLLAGVMLAAAFAVTGWLWAVQTSDAGRSKTVTEGLPAGILWETPTVALATSAVIEEDGDDLNASREQVGDSRVGTVIDVVQAGGYASFSELLTWTETICQPPEARFGPSCSILELAEGTPIRTFPLWIGALVPYPEVAIEETFQGLLAADPRLIAAARDRDSGEVWLEFGVDPRDMFIEGDNGRTTSFLLVVDPGADAPILYFTQFEGGSLIEQARYLAVSGSIVLEMTFVSADATWLDQAGHEVDIVCRQAATTDSPECTDGVKWPGDTWPSRN